MLQSPAVIRRKWKHVYLTATDQNCFQKSVAGRDEISVPDLTIRNAKPQPAPKIAIGEVLYTERTQSVVVRPAKTPARSLPRLWTPSFQGRPSIRVMERILAYGGDWICCGSQTEIRRREMAVTRTLVPFRKLGSSGSDATIGQTRERIQFWANLGKTEGWMVLCF